MDRAAANSLVLLGREALTDLERTFALIERQEQRSPVVLNSKWLLFAYAQIRKK